MHVHILKPFSVSKNLGLAYNESMALLPDNDYGCLCDLDVLFLTSDAGNILHEYAVRYPDAALLTCYCNRVSPLSKMQLRGGKISELTDIKYHIRIAEEQKKELYKATVITGTISGMLMLISKKHWKEFPFPEDGKCLGIDTNYSRMLQEKGKTILRMDGLMVWHTYRLITGIGNKKHLL